MLYEMCMWKLIAQQSEYNVVSCFIFPWVNIQLLFVSLTCVEKNLRFNCYEMRELHLYCMLVIIEY